MLYGNKLRYLRDKDLIKQTELVKYIGISNASYSEFERERAIIPLKHLVKACDYFDVSLDYIFSFTEEPKYQDLRKNIEKETSRLRLKEFRRKNKLTQKDLAAKLKIATSLISDYERDKRLISTNVLYKICKKYNISAD